MARDNTSTNENFDYATFQGSRVELVPGYHLPRKSRTRCVTIAVIAVLMIALVVGIAVTITRKDNDGDNQTNTKPMSAATNMLDWREEPCFVPDSQSSCPWSGVNPVLLISAGGFFADFLNKDITPALKKLQRCGVHTPYMRSVFPASTLPNQYAIVTGLYPASSGIVADEMYDSLLNKSIDLQSPELENTDWWGGEPLWVTAHNQGKRSASNAWLFRPVAISGVLPDILIPYDSSVSIEERVDTVLDWLALDEETRPDCIALYLDQPEIDVKTYGPNSPEIDTMLERVDDVLYRLMNGLLEKGLEGCVNVMVVSDHGMSETSVERQVTLDQYLPDVDDMLVISSGGSGNIRGKYTQVGDSVIRDETGKNAEEIIAALECKNPNLDVFTKATLPTRLHYTHDRVGDVVMRVQDRWFISPKEETSRNKGTSGYDNTFESMKALFIAYGPAFKRDFTAEPFDNIELYNLMAGILNLEPAPNHGTAGSLNYILRDQPEVPNKPPSFSPTVCKGNNKDRESTCSCADNTVNYIPANSNDDVFPFGVPTVEIKKSLCKLAGNQFTSFYSWENKQPSLMSTILTFEQVEGYNSTATSCVFPDPRLKNSENPDCTMYENEAASIVHTQLFHPGLSASEDSLMDAQMSSNMVPMYSGFENGIWDYLWRLIKEYALTYKAIHVSLGPVFDSNYDGRVDGPKVQGMYVKQDSSVRLPSHYFAILIKCSETVTSLAQCQEADIQTLAFVLPHLSKTTNCQLHKEYLIDNVVKIRDVEVLTGLMFLTSLDTLLSARKRTVLQTELWPTSLLTPWIDLPCPIADDTKCQTGYKPLLLVGLDGFGADYLLRNRTPTVSKLSECGVHAPYMRSIYPTRSFPNLYSIVTGLYPESHGMIDNFMYDLSLEQRFGGRGNTNDDPIWWGGEPIWLTAKKQGLKTATFFWPGSDVEIQGEYPDYWRVYDDDVPFSERVQQVLAWMTLPESERPQFITLYFNEPDYAGHRHGPDGEGLGEALERVDDIINFLMDGLVERNLHNCVNLVTIADHGMASTSCDRLVKLSDYVDINFLNANTWVWQGSFGRIATAYIFNGSSSNQISPVESPASTEGLFANLTCANPHLDVYRKSTLPIRYHYSNNERIEDFILDVDAEWIVTRPGSHGYDPIEKSMQALFLAFGPAFRWNETVDAFENIELYNMFTEVLNITPASNNGTMGSLNHILQSPPSNNDNTMFASEVNGTLQYETETDYSNFVESESIRCSNVCKNVSAQVIRSIYKMKTSTVNHDSGVRDFPKLIQRGSTNPGVTILQQSEYALGYDEELASILWVKRIISKHTKESCSSNWDGVKRFQLKESRFLKPFDPLFDKTSIAPVNCIVPDPLIADTPICLDNSGTEIFSGSLLLLADVRNPNQFENISTEFVIMQKEFIEDVWMPLQDLVKNLSVEYGDLEVITGPVFDHDHDSLPDDATRLNIEPSHFYVIISRCLEQDDKKSAVCNTYQAFSVILPHTDGILNCKTFRAYLEDNECRIRDIEFITGLRFFTDLPFDAAMKLRMYLPNGLWD